MSKHFEDSEEVEKIMEDIREKAKNEETQIECLDLIEQHLDKLPSEAYFITKRLSESDDPKIKEKASQILGEYHKKYPELERLEKRLEGISSIARTMSQFMFQSPALKALQQFAEVHQNLRRALFNIKGLQLQYNRLPIYYAESKTDRLANIEAKLDAIYQEIQELKEAKNIDREEYERLKKRLKELEEDVEKAYQ